MRRLIYFLYWGFILHVIAFPEDNAVQSDVDTSVFNPDTLQTKYPYLWQSVKQSMIEKRKGSVTAVDRLQHSIDTNAMISVMITKKTKRNEARAAEINDLIRSEIEYMENKPGLDVARGKLVMNPYLENYAFLDCIDDPSPSLAPRKKRLALKWQISIQIPILTIQYSNTGLFFAFTNRGTFDMFDSVDSRPVTHKTFMPEGFIRLDMAALIKSISTDRFVFQFGGQHESNGGIDDSLSLLDSRNITARIYGQLTTKFFTISPDPFNRYLNSDKYRLIMSVRGFGCTGIEENPDIVKYIGYVDLNASYEFNPKISLFKRECYIGIFKVAGFFAPGGSIKPFFPSYSLSLSLTPSMLSKKRQWYEWSPKLPITFYLRYFRGYNQYLIYYDKLTTVWGFGIEMRK